MKVKTVVMVAGMLLVSALPATAGKLGVPGMALGGRATESWAQPYDAAKGVGDVFSAASWDGLKLGTQWAIHCAQQPVEQQIKDGRDPKGNGIVVTVSEYAGGKLFLSANGPWGKRPTDTSAPLKLTRVELVEQYVENEEVGSRVQVEAEAFDDVALCPILLAVDLGTCIGDSDEIKPPADYPELMGDGCRADRAAGCWYEFKAVTVKLGCPSIDKLSRTGAAPERATSWGALKTLYR